MRLPDFETGAAAVATKCVIRRRIDVAFERIRAEGIYPRRHRSVRRQGILQWLGTLGTHDRLETSPVVAKIDSGIHCIDIKVFERHANAVHFNPRILNLAD